MIDGENTGDVTCETSEIDQKMVGLEMKISFVEDFLEKIQDVCVEHTKEIQSLKAENLILKQNLALITEALRGDILSQKPPHY